MDVELRELISLYLETDVIEIKIDGYIFSLQIILSKVSITLS